MEMSVVASPIFHTESSRKVFERSGSISSPLSSSYHFYSSSECCDVEEEMRGFKTFLIISSMLNWVLMVISVSVASGYNSNTLGVLVFFAFTETAILAMSLIHAIKPSFKVLILFLILSVSNAIAQIILALVMEIKDRDKNCHREECTTLTLTGPERFRFFWLLLSKATYSMFLCLVAVAYAPQVHDYHNEDDWEYSKSFFHDSSSTFVA